MITRIVKLSIKEEYTNDFLNIYLSHHNNISNIEGCISLKVKKEMNSSVIFTISEWDSIDNLEQYRNSDYFINIWRSIKPFFSHNAEAWSLVDI